MKYKDTEIKGAVGLYCNEDPAIQVVRDFEERVEEMGRKSLFKETFSEHPPSVKTELRKCHVERLEEEVGNQHCQGSLVTTKFQDAKLRTSGCFWWLTKWKSCPTYTIDGIFERHEKLLPT